MNRALKFALPIVVLIAAVGGGLWWYLGNDAPAKVSLEAATESVSETADQTAETDGNIDGTWTVDTESGEFDYESATGTFAGFRIEEELVSIGSATAVGRTGDLSGSMTIDGTTVTAATFEIDLSTITTDDSRRDKKVQEALETDQYPTATFTLTEPIELGDDAGSGAPVTVNATGKLTVHGVTQDATFALDAQLVDGTVVVVGTTTVTFSDFGVEVPSSRIVVSVSETGTLELQLLLVRS